MEHPARAHLRARDVPPGFGVGGVGGADRSTADVERGVYKCLFRQTVQEGKKHMYRSDKYTGRGDTLFVFNI